MQALRAHQGIGADADLWASGVSREYRKLLMAGGVTRRQDADAVVADIGGGAEAKENLASSLPKPEIQPELGMKLNASFFQDSGK